MSTELLHAAQRYVTANISVIPVRVADKHPASALLPPGADGQPTWAPFQQQSAADATLKRWCKTPNIGIAVVCGAVSQNLELLDFDNHPPEHPHLFAEWAALVEAQAPGLLARLVLASTQHGGIHAGYRCPEIAGNQKLAQYWTADPATGKPKRETAIETRGEGGYALVAPSPGYAFTQGDLTDPPVITLEEREIMLAAARSLDATAEPVARPTAPASGGKPPAGAAPGDNLRPGDGYNAHVTVAETADLLSKAGWTLIFERNGVGYWRRPGKKGRAWSATLNFFPGKLYVFSSNAYPFDAERAYDPFAVYTLLEHAGDWTAATRTLGRQGYGTPLAARRNGHGPAKTEEPPIARGTTSQPEAADNQQAAADLSPTAVPEPATVITAPATAAAGEELLAEIQAAADREAVEDLLPELTQRCATLGRNELLRVDQALQRRGLSQRRVTAWHTAVNEARRAQRQQATAQVALPDPVAYAAAAGRLWKLNHAQGADGQELVTREPICDFVAHVVAEEVPVGETPPDPAADPDKPQRGEQPARWFQLKGVTITGMPFSAHIDAYTLADPRGLRAALLAAIGTEAVVYPRMEAHLATAILKCRQGPIKIFRRYPHMGWTAEGFIMPGRLPADATLAVAVDIAYRLEPDTDKELARKALRALLRSHDSRRTTVAAMAAFTPALAPRVGWEAFRYAIFIAGVTGSLKSSWMFVLMSLWGRRFATGHGFEKFAEGGSIIAMLGTAAMAYDLPLLLDNYKPQIGDQRFDLVKLLAALIEGDDKARMERDGKLLRLRREIRTWPIVTGEDAPASDASTIARTLIVPFFHPKGEPNPALTEAQSYAEHLTALGAAWLDWLASALGQAACVEVRRGFPALRDQWIRAVAKRNPKIQNPNRIGTNLAVNQLTFWLVCQHPDLRDIFLPYKEIHEQGLLLIAEEMGVRTQEATEAERFIAALRELVGRDDDNAYSNIVIPRLDAASTSDRDRIVGWYDDKGIYLLPGRAREIVEKARGRDYLGNISDATLYTQLDRQGYLADKDSGRCTRLVRVKGGVQRVLQIDAHRLWEGAKDAATTAPAVSG